MVFIQGNALPAMRVGNQLFAVLATFTDRWRTKSAQFSLTTVLTDDGAGGDVDFFIPQSSSDLLSLPDICLELEVAIKFRTSNTD